MKTHEISLKSLGKNFPISIYKKFKSDFGNDGFLIEYKTREWVSSQIKKDDVVFDIGANVGLYSILFSQLSNNVYSFEPTDTFENLLLPNIRRNNITNVNLYKLALGNKIGIQSDKIYMIWGENPIQSDFEFTTLDEFTSKNNIIPNFIKIDVDGFDLEVLMGGKNLLVENNITVCVEINYALHTRGYKEIDVINFMNSIGYYHSLIFDNENFIFKKK